MIFNRDIQKNERKNLSKKIHRVFKKKNLQKQAEVNNRLNMENQERFKNVCLGYTIQANRLMHFAKELQQNQVDQAKEATEILKKIQQNLVEIAAKQKKYEQHLNNSVYCKKMMQPYAKELEQIIAEVDALVKGGKDEPKHRSNK